MDRFIDTPGSLHSNVKSFIGSQLEDTVGFDFSLGIGFRQGADGLGIFSLDAISTLGGPKAWSVPYETGFDRDTTKSGSSGFRASWDKVLSRTWKYVIPAVLTVIWSDAFGLKDWAWNAGLAWAEEDHDIDFYDVQVSTAFIGMLRRF